MAISAQTQYNTYNPDGVVTTFAYSFCAFDEDDIKVYQDDVLVDPANYTVSGIGTRSGGSIVFATAPVVGVAELLIQLEPALARTNDYQQNGELLSSTLDDDIDRLYSVLQYQDLQASRTLTFSDPDATSMVLAGIDTARAGNLLGFDGSGDPALYAPADLTAVSVVTAYAETLLDDANSAAARATLETVRYNREQEGIRYATAGSEPAYTVTTASPAVSAYVTGHRFTVVFDADGTTGSNTINVNAIGAKSLKQYDSNGGKVDAVVKASQIAIIEYDGTDFVILNPLPPIPLTSVRQTVQGGPVTSTGGANFLPATDADLNLVTQNIDSTTPLVVAAAQGFGAGSDRIGRSTANLTFVCTNTATNYLYVTVGADGTLTPGTTTVAPVFQWGGTAAVTSALGTFDATRMVMYVGDGAAATAAWRVYVGEAVASGGAITSTVAYAYNGQYKSSNLGAALSTAYSFNHNIGAPAVAKPVLVCIDAGGENQYVQNEEVNYDLFYATSFYNGVVSLNPNYKSGSINIGAGGLSAITKDAAGVAHALTESKWRLKVYVSRAF